MPDLLKDILWLQNTTVGRAIVATVAAVTLIAAISGLLHLFRYAFLETHRLRAVQGRLQREQEARSSKPDDKSPRALIDLSELAGLVPSSSLIGDRIASIRRMMQARVKISIDALQQMTVLREASSSTLMLPGFVASIALLLGLLGTFYGLSIMVHDLQASLISAPDAKLSASDIAASFQHFRELLSGKQTAFSCTLTGLFCAILLTSLNFLLARSQSSYYDRLERFTTEELLPETVPIVEGETALERFVLQMGDSFERLQDLTNNQMTSLTDLRAIEAGYRALVDGVRAIADRSAAKETQKTVDESASVRELARVSRSVIDLTEKLTHALAQFRQNESQPIRELVAAIRNQQAAFDRTLKSIRDNPSPNSGPTLPSDVGRARWSPMSAVAVAGVICVMIFVLHMLW